MEELIKLNNSTSGRDKFARLLQYISRTIWHILQQRGVGAGSVEKFRSLEYTFSSFRKLLRFGRFLDAIYSAMKTIDYPDQIVRVSLTMARMNYSMFLLCDHFIWMGRAGVMDVNVEKWTGIANKYWLCSIAFNLLRDCYELWLWIKRCRTNNIKPCYPSLFRLICNFIRSRKDLTIDTLKNSCDFFIPFTSLGYAKLSPGAVGVLGIISSVAGIISLIDPVAKMNPA